jgi:glycosyltransferase involved in cell wall biosynthesis
VLELIKEYNKSECKSRYKVSLGVCVRNCEKYARETIESIMDQDYPHELLEIVFVDGCSEDDTLSIIREYVSKIDIKTQILSDHRRGLGYARNLVIANSGGDFVLWVDGDMVLSRDFVTKSVSFMNKHVEVGIAKGKQGWESDGDLVGTLEGFARVAGHMVDYRSEKGRLKSLGTSGSIYRIGVFRDIGGFDGRMRGYGEDQDIEIRARAAGWLLDTVDAKYLDYERHGITWKTLWSRYWQRGYYSHCFHHKNKEIIRHCRMVPPSAFVFGILQSFKLYKLAARKAVFLLPLHHFFKMSAWYAGYVHGHLDNYEPENITIFPSPLIRLDCT